MRQFTHEQMRDLAKSKQLSDADGKPVHIFHPSLRPAKPEVIAPPEKSDVAKAMELVAHALDETMRLSAASSTAQTGAIVAAIQQGNEVVEVPKRVMEQWDCVIRYDKIGRMTGVGLVQIK